MMTMDFTVWGQSAQSGDSLGSMGTVWGQSAPQHTHACTPMHTVRAAQLAEEYQAEEASFREGKSDVFALLRARLRADPALTQTCFDYYDDDKDGRIVGEQVGLRV
jgi:hypothetical protein